MNKLKSFKQLTFLNTFLTELFGTFDNCIQRIQKNEQN